MFHGINQWVDSGLFLGAGPWYVLSVLGSNGCADFGDVEVKSPKFEFVSCFLDAGPWYVFLEVDSESRFG